MPSFHILSQPAARTGRDGLHTIILSQRPASLNCNSIMHCKYHNHEPLLLAKPCLASLAKVLTPRSPRLCKCMINIVIDGTKNLNHAKPKYSLPAVMAV